MGHVIAVEIPHTYCTNTINYNNINNYDFFE